MSEQTHTPGPWRARKVGGQGFPGQVGYAIDFNVDQEQVVDFVYEEADAHLIAAAPDLLAALKYALDALAHCAADKGFAGMQTKAAHMANTAIRKAGGLS
jgi:predicted TIM-barrel fold metal-dependent hydrolase